MLAQLAHSRPVLFPIIPGCILAGIGLGIILEKTVVTAGADDSGAIFLLTMALGFAAITPMTAIFTGGRQIWGVIVGVILAVIGGAFLMGGQAMRALELVGQDSTGAAHRSWHLFDDPAEPVWNRSR